MSNESMTRKQKIINIVSMLLLILVFWNFLKPKPTSNQITEVKPTSAMTPFEKGLDCRCDQDFVVTPSLKVVKKLKDDTKGVKHQKWLVQNESGQIILFVHNLELCKPLNLEKNDSVKLAGEFKWTDKGALIHWTHYDPKKKRPDGYVQIKGQKFCKGHD